LTKRQWKNTTSFSLFLNKSQLHLFLILEKITSKKERLNPTNLFAKTPHNLSNYTPIPTPPWQILGRNKK